MNRKMLSCDLDIRNNRSRKGAKTYSRYALVVDRWSKLPFAAPKSSGKEYNRRGAKTQSYAENFKQRTTINGQRDIYCHLKFHVTEGMIGNSETCRASTFNVPSNGYPVWSK